MTLPQLATQQDPTPGLGIAIQGTNIGLGIPLLSNNLDSLHLPTSSKAESGIGIGLGHPNLRWPYSTRHRSFTSSSGGGYDSSPTPSSSSASSSSESDQGMTRSATHDVLLSYLSPTLSDVDGSVGEEKPLKKVYLLSSGLKQPQMGHRRSKSETFKFPLPPTKAGLKKAMPLKSAMRKLTKGDSPVLRAASAGWRRSIKQLSPQLEEEVEEEGRQGWSPYSSVAPTPRQVSNQHGISILSSVSASSPPVEPELLRGHTSPQGSTSSCSSQTLVSDHSDSDSGAETDPTFSTDAAKLARLHASLFLLDRSSELPLSLPDLHNEDAKKGIEVVGGSVEEQMAYLCGLGYRYGKKGGKKGRKASADYASAREQVGEVGGWWSQEEEEEEKREGRVESHKVGVHRAVRVVSNCASAVTSSCSSPILSGLMAAEVVKEVEVEVEEEEEEEGEGDVTVRQRDILPPAQFEGLLGGEYSYLLDESLSEDKTEQATVLRETSLEEESGLMTPPLTTPELGLGSSPLLLEPWPSPLRSSSTSFPKPFTLSLPSPRQDKVEGIEGCRPYSTSSSLDPFSFSSALSPPATSMSTSVSCPVSFLDPFKTTARIQTSPSVIEEDVEEATKIEIASRKTLLPTTVSVLTRPRPLRSTNSNNSLFSSASSDKLQKPEPTASILARGRPIPPREVANHTFGSKTTPLPARSRGGGGKGGLSKSFSTTTIPKAGSLGERRASAAASAGTGVKVPQRKSSLDVRAQAQLHKQAEAEEERVIHPNSVCRDEELIKKYHSSASPYLASQLQPKGAGEMWENAATAAKQRRRGGGLGGMTASVSLPVLFTARTAAQRAKGEGVAGGKRKSVVSVGPDEEGFRMPPPREGVLVVSEEVTTVVGLAL